MHTTVCLLVGLSLFPATAAAKQVDVMCPANVSASRFASSKEWVSVTAWRQPPGPWSESPLVLGHVEIYAGHPKLGYSLVPNDDHLISRRVHQATWLLRGESWIGCHYLGERNLLAMRLPTSTRSCQMQYETSQSPYRVRVRRLQCKVTDA